METKQPRTVPNCIVNLLQYLLLNWSSLGLQHLWSCRNCRWSTENLLQQACCKSLSNPSNNTLTEVASCWFLKDLFVPCTHIRSASYRNNQSGELKCPAQQTNTTDNPQLNVKNIMHELWTTTASCQLHVCFLFAVNIHGTCAISSQDP